MKRKLSGLIAVLMILASGFSFAACKKKNPGEILVWTFTDELKGMIENYYLRDNPDEKVKVEVYPDEIYQTKLDGVLRTGKDIPDVMALEISYIQKYVQSGKLLSLSSDGLNMEEKANEELYGYTVDVARDASDRVMGLAWQATPGGFFYRRSMATSLWGKSDPAFVQTKLDTWDKFMTVAAELKASGDKRIMSSLNGDMKVFLSQRESPWIVDDKLTIDPVMEQYLDHMRALQYGNGAAQQGMYINETDERGSGWYVDMSQNKVFGYFLPTWGLHFDLKPNASATAGDWGLIQGPAQYFHGGTWLSGYKDSANKEGIEKLLNYIIFNEDFLEEWAENTGDFLSNKRVVDKIKDDYTEPFLGGQNHYLMFSQMVDNIAARNITGSDSAINGIFKEVAIAYSLQDADVKTKEAALERFKIYFTDSFPTLTV
ncbi:MAG: ABC transporter substrate-binding protein [Clostridiales bacterium]|jgi:hypothetical protein|nr:ABC transporter substrate-binding protein [Clostridiales bacterium]